MTPPAPPCGARTGPRLSVRPPAAPAPALTRLLPLALLLVARVGGGPGRPGRHVGGGAGRGRLDAPGRPAAPALDLGVPLAAPAEGGLERARRLRRARLAPDRARPARLGGRGRRARRRGHALRRDAGDVRDGDDPGRPAPLPLGRRDDRTPTRSSPTPAPSGSPQFADGEESFTGRRFTYNLKTRRGRVVRARTQIQDGYLLGGVLKQQDAHVVFAEDVAYTTCSLDHPHYAVEAGRMKVIDGERIYTGRSGSSSSASRCPCSSRSGTSRRPRGRRSGPLPVTYGQESGYGLVPRERRVVLGRGASTSTGKSRGRWGRRGRSNSTGASATAGGTPTAARSG